ncbi:MAG: hypothetical protein WCR20_18295 [Verrucomicrobiota bacterium]
MNRLIISTNFNELYPLINGYNNKGLNKLNDICPTLYYNEEDDMFLDTITNSQIIITKDIVKGKPFDYAKLNICQKTDCLLHHSEPKGHDWGFIDNRRQGSHMPYDPLYPPIFKILLDNDYVSPNKKADHIIKEYFFFNMRTQLSKGITDNLIPDNEKIPKCLLEINGLKELINNLRIDVNSQKIKNEIEKLLYNGQ